jgi:hypothetical protein
MKAQQVSRLRKTQRAREDVCTVCMREKRRGFWLGWFNWEINQGRGSQAADLATSSPSTEYAYKALNTYEYLSSTPCLLIFCSWSSAELHLNNTESQFTFSNLRSVSHPWQGVDSTPYGGSRRERAGTTMSLDMKIHIATALCYLCVYPDSQQTEDALRKCKTSLNSHEPTRRKYLVTLKRASTIHTASSPPF